ncbi:MAG: hypothetical protein IKN86_08865 [Bacteroidaceae bacterium]|nr:hypothetical protein [Bacteroidaceae bacterium]
MTKIAIISLREEKKEEKSPKSPVFFAFKPSEGSFLHVFVAVWRNDCEWEAAATRVPVLPSQVAKKKN